MLRNEGDVLRREDCIEERGLERTTGCIEVRVEERGVWLNRAEGVCSTFVGTSCRRNVHSFEMGGPSWRSGGTGDISTRLSKCTLFVIITPYGVITPSIVITP